MVTPELWDVSPRNESRIYGSDFLQNGITKNDGELVDDASRFGGDRELSANVLMKTGWRESFKSACERLTDDGRLVIVFANKSVDAWETLVGALSAVVLS